MMKWSLYTSKQMHQELAYYRLENAWTAHEILAADSKILWPIACVSQSLFSAETWYSKIECEVQGVPHGLEKFYH